MIDTKAMCHDAEIAADILIQRFRERYSMSIERKYTVTFDIDSSMADEEFAVMDMTNGAKITSGGKLGLIHGAGFILRQSIYTKDDVQLSTWRGTQKPKCSIRGVYFASHFHNFYHVAPLPELRRYIEDLALWGFNYIKLIYPFIDLKNEQDPECEIQISRLRQVFDVAHELGLKTCTSLNVNSGYKEFPREFSFTPHKDPTGRRGNSGNMLCPSIPDANMLVMHTNTWLMERMHPDSLDMVLTWPYDEGGCSCSECYPWGGNGFIRASKQAFQIARSFFPDVLRCVSTWCFDTPYEGEWEALYKSLQEEKWCDVILADAHEDFPRYPLDEHVPGGLPLINFPEISMWGLYPWGGWGATALPERFTGLWQQVGGILAGGFLYSEGIYEDVNKAVLSQFYWNGEADWQETLIQYAHYELGIEQASSFIHMISMIEKTHSQVANEGICDVSIARQTHDIAVEIDHEMQEWARKSWRWRMLFLRTLIDARRYQLAEESGMTTHWQKLNWKELLRLDKPVQDAFQEIIDICHCMKMYNGDMYHGRVRPVCD